MIPRFSAAACGVVFLLGCSDAPEAEHVSGACIPDPMGQRLTDEEQVAPGPFAVGELDLDLVDESRGTQAHGGVEAQPTRLLVTRVYYPATTKGKNAPLADGGPFPLVAYSHGFSSYLTEGKHLADHLASHGYVVFAIEFPLTRLGTPGGPTVTDLVNQPGDVSFVIDTMLELSATQGHLLEGAVDPTRIAAAGLSLGGLTSLLVTYHPTLHDPRIDVVAAMAPPADILGEAFYRTRFAPLLVLSGTVDAIVPHAENAITAFERAERPVTLLTLKDGTHTGFTNVAAALDSLNNADELGCGALSGGGEPPAMPYDLVAALGGEANGIVPGMPAEECPDPLPPGMPPTRQLAIEKQAVLAFFEAYFNPDETLRARHCDYLERRLPRAPDVRIDRR